MKGKQKFNVFSRYPSNGLPLLQNTEEVRQTGEKLGEDEVLWQKILENK